MNTVVFDGRDSFGHYGLYLNSHEIGEAVPKKSFQEMPGANGSIDMTLTDSDGAAFFENRPLRFRFTAIGDVDGIIRQKLAFSTLNGRRMHVRYTPIPFSFYGTVSIGEWVDDIGLSAVTVEVDAEPFLYGPEHRIPIEASLTDLFVAGNKPVFPVIECVPKNVSYIRVGNEITGDFVQVNASFNSSKVFRCDMESRRCTVDGAAVPFLLTSRFFAVNPGEARIRLSSGTGTLIHRERWLL